MEIEKKTERRVGETLKECVARKIAINIREGKPRDQAVAISFSQCSLRKELSDEVALEILEELERDEFLFPILEGAADAFEKAGHLRPQRKKKKKKKKRSGGTMYKQNEGAQGEHGHPHEPNGKHTHPDLPGATGGHSHEGPVFGRHRHRDDDPLEGGHPNAGSGKHRHLMSAGLINIVDKIVVAHYPVHKWIPNFKQAWIMHPGEQFRTTTRKDWVEHALFSLHSAGCSIDDHMLTFTNENTRLLEIKYEMKDGSIVVPGKEDWEKECNWFRSELPEVEKFLNLNAFVEEESESEEEYEEDAN